MTATQSMPQVQECSVSSCSYNADSSCHAGVITIAGDHAHCGTFVEISFRSGLDRTGLAGAGGARADVADCLTYSAR